MDRNIKAITLGLHKDLFFEKKVSISFDTIAYTPTADLNVLVQIEPPSIHNIVDGILHNQHKFDMILAWNRDILANCSNSILFPFGDCWIHKQDQQIYEKTEDISIIASAKKQTAGHRLRHEIIRSCFPPLDLFGNGYNPIENKITALRDYRFSVVIENERSDNCFTEKLIDCLLTGTVPVYWGCPNINQFFDTKGFILFDSESNFISNRHLLSEHKYTEMLPYIKNNFQKALPYAELWLRIENEIYKLINRKYLV